jgi:hypothetical protein
MAGLKEGSWAYKKSQHEHQMEIQVLNMAPMKRRHYQTGYDMEME